MTLYVSTDSRIDCIRYKLLAKIHKLLGVKAGELVTEGIFESQIAYSFLKGLHDKKEATVILEYKDEGTGTLNIHLSLKQGVEE